MSIYSEISKQLGWTGRSDIPCIEVAEAWLEKVKNKDQAAFYNVFHTYRFAQSPKDENERRAMQIIQEAFTEGRNLFL